MSAQPRALDPSGNIRNRWFLLLFSLVTVGASMVLTTSDEWVYAFGWPLPEVCTLRKVLGIRCPGCGLTRSFVFMGHGEWLSALRMHWLGPITWLVVAVQIPRQVWLLIRPPR
jgi:hypothetical protein